MSGSGECGASAIRQCSGCDGHLEDSVALVRKELKSLLDPVEREAVGDHRAEIDTTGSDHAHQSPHPLLAARAKGGHNPVVAEAGVE